MRHNTARAAAHKAQALLVRLQQEHTHYWRVLILCERARLLLHGSQGAVYRGILHEGKAQSSGCEDGWNTGVLFLRAHALQLRTLSSLALGTKVSACMCVCVCVHERTNVALPEAGDGTASYVSGGRAALWPDAQDMMTWHWAADLATGMRADLVMLLKSGPGEGARLRKGFAANAGTWWPRKVWQWGWSHGMPASRQVSKRTKKHEWQCIVQWMCQTRCAPQSNLLALKFTYEQTFLGTYLSGC